MHTNSRITLICQTETLAQIISSLIKKEMKKNNEMELVDLKQEKEYLMFVSNRTKDPHDTKFYKYYDTAYGIHIALTYGLD